MDNQRSRELGSVGLGPATIEHLVKAHNCHMVEESQHVQDVKISIINVRLTPPFLFPYATGKEYNMRLFPKQIDFFELFDVAALNVSKGAALLVQLMQDLENMDLILKEIHEAEKEGDMMTHDIMKKLNKTFITPIDREDLHALASRLDDVIDLIWASGERFSVFKLRETTKEAVEMAKDILTTTEVINKAIRSLKAKNYSYVQEYCIEINRLENRVDRIYREALVRLFDEGRDAIYVIKWKEVYEHLEDASDRCEDVANIIEGIVLKYA